MADLLDYLMSPRGMPLFYAMGCVVWLVIMLESIFRKQISFGSIPPKIRESENPRTFWSIIFLYGGIATWAGVSAALALL